MMKPISPIYINVKGRLLDLATPQVMGILNVTPDSFYSGSRMQTEEDIAARARQILDEGASIIDIGAYSSRSNAEHISAEEEMRRLRTGLEILNRNHPEAIISVDTFRADVAEECVKEYGVAMATACIRSSCRSPAIRNKVSDILSTTGSNKYS